MRMRAAILLAVLAGCSTLAAQSRYRGTIAGCGEAMPATLVREGKRFAFTPGDGVLEIHGTVAADGSFAGTLNTQPAGKAPFELKVSGRLDAKGATFAYSTPRCQTSGRLVLVPVSLLP